MNFKKICFLSIIVFLFFALGAKANVPATISDLECVYSGIPGSVLLTWTPPTGATGYEAAYSLSAFDESEFNLATQFPQNWAGSASQGLVNYLAQDHYWFFAVKAENASGTSAISNVVFCLVPTYVKTVTTPLSVITDPQNGAPIPVGQTYTILGQATDVGGSSIQKVEISFDGGSTWLQTTAVAHIDTGFTWGYNWTPAVAGNYNIKTRATDWLGYVEVPGEGTFVTVSAAQASTSTLSEQETITQLKAQINQLQLQIIKILQQLIALVRQRI